MAESATPRRILRFGSFEVDLASGELRRQGLKIRLQDQPLRLLALLLERAGEVVTREELRDKLWPADTFVDFDHSLNTAVRKLREALGDSAETPRYVETLARRGYRFVAPLAEPGPTAPLAHSADADVASASPPPATRKPPSARRALVIAAVLASAALVAYWVGGRPRPRTPPGRRLTLAVLPFDNLSGDADQEYLSDGLTEEMILLQSKARSGPQAGARVFPTGGRCRSRLCARLHRSRRLLLVAGVFGHRGRAASSADHAGSEGRRPQGAGDRRHAGGSAQLPGHGSSSL